MSKAVGVDLGTTNSVIAAMEGGQPVVIVNGEGARTTPSVVAFTGHGDRLVGQLARRQAIMNPKGTISSAKRFVGRRHDEVSSERNSVTCDVVAGPDGAVRFEVRDTRYAPEEVSALVLRKLVEDASKFLGERVTEAVKEQAPIERLRSLTSELQRIHHGLGAAGHPASAGVPGGAGQTSGSGGSSDRGRPADDVIDAEFTAG